MDAKVASEGPVECLRGEGPSPASRHAGHPRGALRDRHLLRAVTPAPVKHAYQAVLHLVFASGLVPRACLTGYQRPRGSRYLETQRSVPQRCVDTPRQPPP